MIKLVNDILDREKAIQNIDPHIVMETDMHKYFGNFCHISNKIDDSSSGHGWLRNTFIDILEDSNCYAECRSHYLCGLNSELRNELRQMLQELNINVEIKAIGNKEPFACSPETQRRWLIEKKYLLYWLNLASKCEISYPETNGWLLNWQTDGQRIAYCYYKNWIKKKN